MENNKYTEPNIRLATVGGGKNAQLVANEKDSSIDNVEKSVPSLRFSEFEGEWEKVTLNDISKRVKRKTSKDSQSPIMMISASDGFIFQSEKYSNDNTGNSLANYTLLKKGELAYNHGCSKLRKYGSCFTLYEEEARIPFVYHTFKILNNDSYFYGIYLNSGLFDKELRKLVSSTARLDGLLNISYEAYVGIKVACPTFPEQQKIASYFTSLDQQIKAATKRVASLKQVKAACLQSMFPQEGETVPKVRFQGFEGEWKERRLGKLFVERVENNVYGEMLSVTMNDGIIRASDNGRFDNSNSDKSKYKVVKVGDIAYNSMRMWQGASGCSDYEGIVSPAYTVVVPQGDINSTFFACLFKTDRMIEIFRLNSQGLTSDTWNLKYPAFAKICVRYPESISEQQKIATFFTSLDKQIYLESQRLEKLKQVKKACLDKMFV